MSNTPSSSPAPGTDLASRRGFAVGKWIVAVPLHLTLAIGLVVGCASSTASTDPVADPGPVPGTVTTVPAAPSPSATPSTGPSPTASRTPGSVTTVSPEPAPEPAETPVRAVTPPSGAFLALEDLAVAAAGTMSDYDRDALFGGWIDADGDCEDSRNEVLARDLTGITSADGCRVDTGTLADPYTGASIDFVRGVATSSDVQVDHVVSLGNAWVTGARRLSQADRVALANDPQNLLAVDGPANGSKSDQDASEWLPPNRAFACDMVAVQIAVKSRYGLWVTAPEKDAMAEVLSGCPDQQLPGGSPFGDIPEGAGSAPEPAPAPAEVQEAPAAPAPADVHYANCTAAREAGAAPLHRGDPGYRDAMDRDGDGVACE
ncbi:excalibur calcium-binding domain-containing protein [uncultured Kocuria sp.]|uniref:excalibur calcium-binding domain-containing protein n=1 Tax=uncultured Kocuria sp. TaxID=259305 RepID=UPI00261047A0|nr:excalibur calcium-binding domain-containing protein [uncultured Kocuria sp.]